MAGDTLSTPCCCRCIAHNRFTLPVAIEIAREAKKPKTPKTIEGISATRIVLVRENTPCFLVFSHVKAFRVHHEAALRKRNCS